MSSPRTVEQLVQETLGAQLMMILRLQADNEAANAKIAELTPAPPKPVADEG